jgi:hypothetical protein
MSRTADEPTRAILVQMAQVWFRLAEERLELACEEQEEKER